jgi:hypothetical protein
VLQVSGVTNLTAVSSRAVPAPCCAAGRWRLRRAARVRVAGELDPATRPRRLLSRASDRLLGSSTSTQPSPPKACWTSAERCRGMSTATAHRTAVANSTRSSMRPKSLDRGPVAPPPVDVRASAEVLPSHPPWRWNRRDRTSPPVRSRRNVLDRVLGNVDPTPGTLDDVVHPDTAPPAASKPAYQSALVDNENSWHFGKSCVTFHAAV